MIERILIFGASGDLTARLLLPAMAQLVAAGELPARLELVGASTQRWSTGEFRQHIRDALATHAAELAPAARDAVVQMLTFQTADVTQAQDVSQVLGDHRRDTLVYLALPPSLLEPALRALATCGLRASDAVAIEKPFGTDLASARRLNEILRVRMPQPTIFRIDHFLSDELVRQVVALRFANRVFEPTWNAVHVERVDISWLERLTIEGRAAYYDKAGALKDMIQSHLLEALALILMAEPARIDPVSFREARVEALRTVATPTASELRARSVRARYTAGTIDARPVPSYVDERGVDGRRNTETYASVTFEVNSTRWAGVPFTLRSGKAMTEDRAEIAIHFRPLPAYVRERYPGTVPNVIRLGLTQPYIRLSTAILGGRGQETREHDLSLCARGPRRSPYAHLVLEMLRGDRTLFLRGDEAEEAWRIIDPVAKAWRGGEVPMRTYPAGGTLPEAS